MRGPPRNQHCGCCSNICDACSGCDASKGVKKASFEYWNKFYTNNVCKLNACGNAGNTHKAQKTTFQGTETYKYHMVLPS